MTRRDPRLRILAVLAAVFVGALALDRLVAAVIFAHPGRYVPTYRSSYHPSVGVKLEQLRSIGRLDGVFLGNSLAMMDVDPTYFDARMHERHTGFRSYNLAVPGVGVQFWPRFVNQYLADDPPRLVLLGVQPRDVDLQGEQISQLLEPRFYGSNAYMNRDLGRVDRAAEETLSRVFVLWGRNGDFLRALGGLRHHRRYDPDDLFVASDLGWSRAAPQFEHSRAELLSGRRRYANRHGPADFAIVGSARASLRDLNEWVREHGGRLILFTLPILYDSEPEGTVEVETAFHKDIRRLARRLPGVTLLDSGPHGTYTWRDYSDENHLNARGARRFSTSLGAAVDRLTRTG